MHRSIIYYYFANNSTQETRKKIKQVATIDTTLDKLILLVFTVEDVILYPYSFDKLYIGSCIFRIKIIKSKKQIEQLAKYNKLYKEVIFTFKQRIFLIKPLPKGSDWNAE